MAATDSDLLVAAEKNAPQGVFDAIRSFSVCLKHSHSASGMNAMVPAVVVTNHLVRMPLQLDDAEAILGVPENGKLSTLG